METHAQRNIVDRQPQTMLNISLRVQVLPSGRDNNPDVGTSLENSETGVGTAAA